jgi:hypothetical protein
MHTTRIVAAYRLCVAKVKGLKVVYQQQLRYIQAKGLHVTPLELCDKDLTNQLSKWCMVEEGIILLMDVNEHPTKGKFSRKLAKMNLDMHKFSHKYWGPTPPNTHIKGTQPITSGYISSKIEVLNLAMLNFRDSLGNHRLLILKVSTRSLLGKFWHKVCWPVSRRLVTSQQLLVDRYNRIVQEQFKMQCIKERLDAVDRMAQYCRHPAPGWLRGMITKLYKQMTEIWQHAKKKCCKILRPGSNFSPALQLWYNRIHAYLQLICLKEGKAQNVGNIMRLAKHKQIEKHWRN